MAEQPQWYTKKGPDGKWYKTQAASPEEAVAKMTKAWTSQTSVPSKPIDTGTHIGAPPPLMSIAGMKEAGYKGADWLTRALPAIGGTVGGIAGTAGEPGLGTVAGAGIGGALGKEGEQVLRKAIFGERTPETLAGELGSVFGEGGKQGLLELFGMGVGRLGRLIAPADRSALIAYATRSGEMGPKISKVLPDLNKAAAASGPVRNIADFENLVNHAKTSLDQEFNKALFPIAQQSVVAAPVGNAIRQEIASIPAKTAEGRATRQYLLHRAQEFEKGTWTVSELNMERMRIGQRLKSFHDAIGRGAIPADKISGQMAADAAAERALKDILYDAADRSAAAPPGYFKALKQRQSMLIDFDQSVKAAKDKLTKASLERKGAPLSEKIHLRGYLHPQSGVPGGVAGISPSMFSDPLKQSSSALRKAFPTGARAVSRATREAVSRYTQHPDVNALPLRALLIDDKPKDEQ